jgi:hypothetical protein
MNPILEKGTNFLWKNARSLERAIFDYRFRDGSASRVLAILSTYQNEDGGFGHALEPDLRAPDSHPLAIEFALRKLYENKLRDAGLAWKVCEFLSRRADFQVGIPMVFPSYKNYPHADHMDNPIVEQPSLDRLAGLVGLLRWQKAQHPWLQEAVEICLRNIGLTKFKDAHTILTTFTLIESLSEEREIESYSARLASDLFEANFFSMDVSTTSYGMTPLHFAPEPHAFCRKYFPEDLIEAHLVELASQQEEDGGWPIRWNPPGEMARCEWRAEATLGALSILRAYGKI